MTDDLPHLTDVEHVRTRPSMYIGDTKTRGLHHCVFEMIDYANNRHASRIDVSVHADGSYTVADDGFYF